MFNVAVPDMVGKAEDEMILEDSGIGVSKNPFIGILGFIGLTENKAKLSAYEKKKVLERYKKKVGLLTLLNDNNVPASFYVTSPVRILINYKWSTFARQEFFVYAVNYSIYLTSATCFGIILRSYKEIVYVQVSNFHETLQVFFTFAFFILSMSYRSLDLFSDLDSEKKDLLENPHEDDWSNPHIHVHHHHDVHNHLNHGDVYHTHPGHPTHHLNSDQVKLLHHENQVNDLNQQKRKKTRIQTVIRTSVNKSKDYSNQALKHAGKIGSKVNREMNKNVSVILDGLNETQKRILPARVHRALKEFWAKNSLSHSEMVQLKNWKNNFLFLSPLIIWGFVLFFYGYIQDDKRSMNRICLSQMFAYTINSILEERKEMQEKRITQYFSSPWNICDQILIAMNMMIFLVYSNTVEFMKFESGVAVGWWTSSNGVADIGGSSNGSEDIGVNGGTVQSSSNQGGGKY